jgi:hypothetical protein
MGKSRNTDKYGKFRQHNKSKGFTGPKHGTLNHPNKPSKQYTLPEDRKELEYDPVESFQ